MKIFRDIGNTDIETKNVHSISCFSNIVAKYERCSNLKNQFGVYL